MSNVTNRNPNPALPLTERNTGTYSVTVQNPGSNDVTVRNIVTEDFINFSESTILLGEYVITDRLPITSGEANIYSASTTTKNKFTKFTIANLLRPKRIDFCFGNKMIGRQKTLYVQVPFGFLHKP